MASGLGPYEIATRLDAPVGAIDGIATSPMLCERDSTDGRLLGADGWSFELKLDGVRILADKRGGDVTLSYRKQRDATEAYPEIARAVATFSEQRLLLDGEIVAFDDQGNPDFQLLGQRIQASGDRVARAAALVPVVYVPFDILAVGDRDLTSMPIEVRRAILEAALPDVDASRGPVRALPTFPDGHALMALCRERGLEGVVAKRAGSAYRLGVRSPDWVKVKAELAANLVVVGWTEGEGGRARLGALDVASWEGQELVVRGTVGSGLDEAAIDGLLGLLRSLEVSKPAVPNIARNTKRRHFVKPSLVVSVRYGGMTREGILKFPVFRGVRPDLDVEDCVIAKRAP